MDELIIEFIEIVWLIDNGTAKLATWTISWILGVVKQWLSMIEVGRDWKRLDGIPFKVLVSQILQTFLIYFLHCMWKLNVMIFVLFNVSCFDWCRLNLTESCAKLQIHLWPFFWRQIYSKSSQVSRFWWSTSARYFSPMKQQLATRLPGWSRSWNLQIHLLP